jgi:hypothetical protein
VIVPIMTYLELFAGLRGTLSVTESRKHTITAKLRQIPSLGPIRPRQATLLVYQLVTGVQLWSALPPIPSRV